VIGRQPSLTSQNATWNAMWRGIRSWVCHNHKLYYSYVILCGLTVYNFWWYVCVNYYRNRNWHRSLPVAEVLEREALMLKAIREAEEEAAYGDEEGEEE